MTVFVGGHETGLGNTSLALLNRNDRSGTGDPGHGEQLYVNVSNGNLVIQHQDVFLPSLGDDYFLVRTYNSRGRANDSHEHEDARWTFSTTVRLNVRNDGGTRYFEVENGDGSVFDYQFDAGRGLYVSTDGAGAYGTLEDLGTQGGEEPSYLLTRADQSRLYFDSHGRLMRLQDPNGVRVDYVYESDRLVQVLDDQGHVLTYHYQSGILYQVTDESQGVLVEYRYESGLLSEVIDRYGHSTRYFYTKDGFLERISLPAEQTVEGQLESYQSRELSFAYEDINWRGNNRASAKVLTQVTDASGGVTTFDYDFDLVNPSELGPTGVGHTTSGGKGHLKHEDDLINPDVVAVEDKFFVGGSTLVVDALGNNRAYSNDAPYVQWRLENGYYEKYSPGLSSNPNLQAQVEAIRNSHGLTYSYRQDGYITEVVDAQGLHTLYRYDARDNLISVTDRNGWGVTHSDSAYYRALRAELGVVDGAGQGKRVSELSASEIEALQEAFTSHFEYDERGNLTRSLDNADNETTFTYTPFNKVASSTTAVGNALARSNDAASQAKRVELGYAAQVEELSGADIQALLDLHTTFYQYDERQNLIERRDPGADITRFEYDAYGNLTRRIVYLDSGDLLDAAKQQVTTYAYDGFGNNISSTDAQGYQSFSQYDHFGNLTRFTDANGGVSRFTYDADHRLLTVTDPEGHTTVNTYDAVGNRISLTDANGHTVTRLYDRNNRLIATLDPSSVDAAADRLTRFEYDVVGNRTAVIDAQGHRTDYVFNARRELVEVLSALVEDGQGQPIRYSSSFAYDGEGNRIRTTDNRGYTTEILYTQHNLIREQSDPTGHITRFEYDANGNQLRIIAGMQLPLSKRQILQFSYDEENQLIRRTDAEGNVTRYAYDAPGNRVALIDANGNATHYEYDGNNRLLREIRPEVIDPRSGEPVRYSLEHRYDGNGNQIQTIDENGHSTRFTFDRDDKLVMVEDANGIKTVFEYDSRHNRTAVLIGVEAVADAAGHITLGDVTEAQTTRYFYNEFNELISQVDGVGNALAESDGALYQALRKELGYAALAADLSEADRQALRGLYTRRFTYDRVGNQLSQTDPLGRSTHFAYDGLGRLISRTDAAGQTTSFGYDGNGNRVAQRDAQGHLTTFAYDGVNRLTDTTDALGVVTQRRYDDFGNLVEETRAFGTLEARTTGFEYDLNNRLLSQIDPEGHRQSFEYDAVGNRIRLIDGRDNATEYLYDALNRNIRILDPLNFQTRFEYDGVGNRLALIDARGGVSRFEYDPGNRRIATTDAEGRLTTYAYDVRGNRIEQRTAAGTAQEQVTTFEYDAQNNLRRVIDAEGGITENHYDRVYNRIAITDANGNTTHSEFDAVDRVIRVTDAHGQSTQFSYDAVGNRLTQTDALGRVTRFVYDDNDRLIRQIAADGVETRFAYDAVGNRTQITRAAGTAQAATDTFVYDRDDRLTVQIDALGNQTRYAYDANHNRTVVTDPRGHATVYSYDENNRVIQIQDPEGHTVRYGYDGNGNRTQVIDGRGSVATTYYNANGEVLLSVDALGYATSYTYDANGNVLSQTRHMQALGMPVDPAAAPQVPTGPADQTTRFQYDRLNRVTARIDAEGYRSEFVYDAVGNRLESRQFRDLEGTDVAVTRSYYDALNREVAKVSAQGYLSVFTYDAVSNRTSRTLYDEPVTASGSAAPQPASEDAGRTTAFHYDLLNRLEWEESPLGVITRYEYDLRGNRTALIEAAGSTEERRTGFLYDRADRLTDTIDALGTVTHLRLDAGGNVTERREAYGTLEERLTSFAYDGNNRLIHQVNALGVTTEMAYDANGNLTRRTQARGLAQERTETMEYDRNNRLVAQVNGEGERTESAYDGAGNRIRLTLAPGLAEERTNTFAFDREGRLIAAVDGEGVRTEYRYDGAGNKVETIQAAGVAAEQRHSLYQYDLDNRLTQVTDPLGGLTRYSYDALGNQRQIFNANGGVQTNTFDALGRLVSSLSAGGVLTVNTYDLRGNIVGTTQSFADGSDARTTTYGYDLLDRQERITDPEGFSTTIEYDPFGNQTRITHGQYLLQPGQQGYEAAKAARAFPQSNLFSYDKADRMLSLEDAEGNLITYGYDAVGNRTRMTEAANSEPRTTLYRYDLAGRLTETVHPEGGVSRNLYDATGNRIAEQILQSAQGTSQVWITRGFEYDGNARLVAQIDGEGHRTEYGYDAMGNQTLVRQGAGTADERISRSQYDLNNRLSVQIDGEGHRSEFTYDAMGNRIRVTDALGRVARYYFDGSNNLVAILDAEGYINTFSYDSAGNRTGESIHMARYSGPVHDFTPPVPTPSALDRVFVSVYDGNGRITQRLEADGTLTTYAYDGAGNLKREVQFANTDAPRQLLYQYDLNNRLIHFTDVDGTITTFTYDGANNKTSETITSATDPNAVRRTLFSYDLNNRVIQEVFDPSGLNLIQTKTYDALGNVIAKTDANGHATRFEYDLNNRLVRQIDPLQNDTHYSYDAVGNQIAFTDANGRTTHFVYDGNNRLIREIGPEVEVYTLQSGEALLVRPTTVRSYDGAGNEIQLTDPAGFTTTRYYDSNNRLVAEISGDNVLRQWSYNGAGEPIGESLYMTRLPGSSHDPRTRPAAPAGEVRTLSKEYDLAGRLTRIVYPAVEVTTLVDAHTDTPTVSVSTVQPEERFVYDSFGNKTQVVDRNGNRTLAWYDLKGRLVAQVDPEGYLTEFDYDAQDNVIEQRLYATALDPATLDPATPPAAPSGAVYQTNRVYDAASRLIEERSPLVEVFEYGNQKPIEERVITRYSYDGVGNQTSRTLAAGTSQQSTEYSYFDALGRQVAVVDGNRVLNLFGYDANGNQTLAKRFFNPVQEGIDLASLDGAGTNFTLLVSADSKDQTLQRLYDALNRLTRETDLMGEGSADDLIKSFGYDANGNRTLGVDEDGYQQSFSYDAVGRLVKSIGPDGSGTVYEYDAAGNQIRAYTGQLQSLPAPATNLGATLQEELLIHWSLPPQAQVQSYVLYDTVSHPGIAGYAHQSATQGTWFSQSGSAPIPLEDLTSGDRLYFRVVTRDAAGSMTWSAEQAITLPPRLTGVQVRQSGADTLEVTAELQGGALSPKLLYGMPGAAATSVDLVDQGGGRFKATLSGLTNAQELVYRISWQDATGSVFSTPEVPFEAQGGHTGVLSTLASSTVVSGGETLYKAHVTTTVPASLAEQLLTLSANWERLDVEDGQTGDVSVAGLESAQGYFNYEMVLGEDEAPLEAGTYRVTLIGVAESEDLVLDVFEITLGQTLLSGSRGAVSWSAPEVGDAQRVIVDGVSVPTSRDEGRLIAEPGLHAPGTVGYSAFYGTAAAQEHTTTVTSTQITQTTTDTSTDPPTVTVTVLGYDLGVAIELSDEEASAIDGELRLAWRPAASGTDFAQQVAMTAQGSTFHTTLATLPAGQYDLKAYYLDAQGNEVIVDWLRLDTASAQTVTTSASLTVLARETDGAITLSASQLLSVDPGLYSGPAGGLAAALTLSAAPTGNAGGSLRVDGRATGYFTESRYNALDALIATNVETGILRQFGVDANGNTVVTYNLGLDAKGEAITTLSAFDGRNREIARFGAPVSVHGQDQERRAVTRLEYDVQDNLVAETDARGSLIQRTWSALGSQLTQTDQLNNTTIFRYDRLGRKTAEIDALGNARYTRYEKVGHQQLEHHIDAEGHTTTTTMDLFGRRIQVTNALGQSVTMDYDQRDRLLQATDGEGIVHRYEYDGRNNRTASINVSQVNYDILNVLDQVETSIRAIYEYFFSDDGEGGGYWLPTAGSGGTFVDDGEGGTYWGIPESDGEGGTYIRSYSFRSVYTGSQKDVIRQRAQDLGVSYDYWGDSLLDHPAELRQLLTEMGFSAILGAAAFSEHATRQIWDGLGRVVDTVTYQNRQEIHERSQYDVYGNLVASTDGEGRITTRVYGEFGRLMQEIDPGGRITFFEYDDQGRLQREWNLAGKDIRRSYDDDGRLLEVNDLGTGVRTLYTYDIAGNRMSEIVATRETAHDRNISYEYDAVGQMVRWADSITGMHTNYQWDAAGNLHRAMTDVGYDPHLENTDLGSVLSQVEAELRAIHYEVERDDGEGNTWTETVYPYSGSQNEVIRSRAQGLGIDLERYDRTFNLYTYDDGEGTSYSYWTNNLIEYRETLRDLLSEMGYGAELNAAVMDPQFRLVDHLYEYDNNNRVLQVSQRGEIETGYGYDAAGNRIQMISKGTTTEYVFDANGRVIRAESGGKMTADWLYDAVGNVTRFRTFKSDGSLDKVTTKLYYENNRNYYTIDDGQRTSMNVDLSGRVTRTTVVDDGKTYTYDYFYNDRGLETQVVGRGRKLAGTTISSYDVNDQLVTVNKGKGEEMDRAEVLRFVYNNDGQILYRFHDKGKGSEITHTEYAYANGYSVGETGNVDAKKSQTLLDTGKYNLVQPLGEDFPGSVVTSYTARQGDTLQSIAAAVYGNPSLWFVLAEANGLEPGAALKEGQRIEIPNTVKSGRLTADTHKVYDQSDIVGSTLPNLKSTAKKGCGSFLAIIIVVIIAIVAIVATWGLATYVVVPAVGGVIGAGTAATVVGFAIAGAIVGAAASMIQQGLFIALGYQDEFSWKSVAAGAVSGMFAGAAQGFGQVAAAMKSIEAIRYAQMAARAMQVASAASKQLIENGKITSWASLAAAAVGPVRGVGADGKIGNVVDAVGVVTKGAETTTTALGTALQYVTPWLDVAESYVRTGEVSPATWASAIGATLNTAVAKNGIGMSPIFEGSSVTVGQLTTNMLVGGALSLFDKDAAVDYIANYVGNEIGSFIGTGIANSIGQGLIASAIPRTQANAVMDPDDLRKTEAENELSANIGPGTEEDQRLEAPSSSDHLEERSARESQDPITQRIVNSGDTLSEIIAETYGKGYDEELILKIAALNGYDNPNQIQAGDELVLPPFDSELLTSQTISESLRNALKQSVPPSVQNPPSAESMPAEQISAAEKNIEQRILEEIASGNSEEAAKLEEVKKLLQDYIASVKASQDQQRQDLADNSFLENLGQGVKNFGTGIYEAGKMIVDGAVALHDEQRALISDLASGVLNGGDFSAAGARLEGYFDSAEKAIEFAKTGAEIIEFVMENDELRGIITQGAKDILGDINADQVTVFAGEMIGELLLAAVTAGAGTAANAARRGGTTGLKLIDELAGLVRMSNKVDVNPSQGVRFFGKQDVHFYTVENATLGNPKGSAFFMPLDDAAIVRNSSDALRYTGNSPSVLDAYKAGEDIYGISFPTNGLEIRTPTAIDAGDYPHFLEGGKTAVRLPEPNGGYLLNPTREFVTPGSNLIPKNSVLFKLGPNGSWIPIKHY